eukprot:3939412-Rhodomonas_salina.3
MSKAWEPLMQTFLNDAAIRWNDAGICNDLMAAFHHYFRIQRNQKRDTDVDEFEMPWFGVLDRLQLQECVKWRAVMNVTITMFNISTATDTTLLSWRGILNMIVNEAELAATTPSNSMLAHPTEYAEAMFYVIAQLEDMEGFAEFVRRLYVIGRRWIQTTAFQLQRFTESHNAKEHTNRKVTTTKNDTANVDNATFNGSQSTTTYWDSDVCVVSSAYTPTTAIAPVQNSTMKQMNETFDGPVARHRGASRSLKQDDFATRFQWDWTVDWKKFEGSWNGENAACELFDIADEAISNMWNATSTYYSEGYVARNISKYGIMDNVMHAVPVTPDAINARNKQIKSSTVGMDESGFLNLLLGEVFVGVKMLLGIDEQSVVSFFDPELPLETQIEQDLFTLPRILNDFTKCNVERVMLCNTRPRALVPTIAICIVLIWFVCQLLAMSSGTMVLVMFLILPWVVMWYAYGFSPMCFPMIPTCIMTDTIHALNSTFPSRMEWPALLIHQENCTLEGVPHKQLVDAGRNISNCFKSCASDEFGFRSFEDPVAWFLCDLDVPTCQRFSKWIVSQTSFASRYNETTAYFSKVLAFGNKHVTVAHRTCGYFTGFYIIPAFLMLLWIIFMFGAFLKALITLSFKTLVFVLHSQSDEVPDTILNKESKTTKNDKDDGGGGNNDDDSDDDDDTNKGNDNSSDDDEKDDDKKDVDDDTDTVTPENKA